MDGEDGAEALLAATQLLLAEGVLEPCVRGPPVSIDRRTRRDADETFCATRSLVRGTSRYPVGGRPDRPRQASQPEPSVALFGVCGL